jgi:hypothetical protein
MAFIAPQWAHFSDCVPGSNDRSAPHSRQRNSDLAGGDVDGFIYRDRIPQSMRDVNSKAGMFFYGGGERVAANHLITANGIALFAFAKLIGSNGRPWQNES